MIGPWLSQDMQKRALDAAQRTWLNKDHADPDEREQDINSMAQYVLWADSCLRELAQVVNDDWLAEEMPDLYLAHGE